MSDSSLLLALETATSALSVALLRGKNLLDEERAAPGPAAETLLPAIDSLLARAEVTIADLDAFAVSIGPGSFTSLRVGIATAKGLAFGSGRPVAAVPTLAALACRTADAGDSELRTRVALLDARRGEVYAAGWRLAGEAGVAEAALPVEGVYTPAELARALPPRALLVGEGVALCGERVLELAETDARLGPPCEPRAADVGVLGLRLLVEGRGVDAADLVPRYVRRADAEVKRTGHRFE